MGLKETNIQRAMLLPKKALEPPVLSIQARVFDCLDLHATTVCNMPINLIEECLAHPNQHTPIRLRIYSEDWNLLKEVVSIDIWSLLSWYQLLFSFLCIMFFSCRICNWRLCWSKLWRVQYWSEKWHIWFKFWYYCLFSHDQYSFWFKLVLWISLFVIVILIVYIT